MPPPARQSPDPGVVDEVVRPADDLTVDALASMVLAEEARRRDEQRARDELVIDDGALLGVGGDAMPMREVVRAGGFATIAVLFGLLLVDEFDRSAFAVLGPDIQRTLHLSDLSLGLIGALGGFLLFVAAVPIGYLADRMRRTAIVGVCSAVWAAFALLTGGVRHVWQLVVTRTMAGLGKANEVPVQNALLADAYPIAGRSRVYAIHRAAQPIGLAIGPALAGGIAALAGGDDGWRWAFVVLALPAAALALLSFGLREPARGGNEQRAVLGEEFTAGETELPVTIGAAFARLKKVKTFSYFLMALGALGFAVVTAPVYVNLILEENFHLSAGGRGVAGSLTAVGGIVGVFVGGTVGDRLFRQRPEQAMRLIGALIGVYGVTLPLSVYMPNAALYVIVGFVSQAVIIAAFVPAAAVIAAVTPYRLRSMGFATIGIYLSLVGGIGGALIVGGIADSLGRQMALLLTAPAASFAGGALIAYGAKFVRSDMNYVVTEILEERDERQRISAGGDVPTLQVRHLDYSYGPVQVLFDVNVDVRPGEVLALLGTNGAGKSTLLRAISGLGLPDRGVVRLEGRTVTLADPSTRVRMGIVQVPGGRGVFPGLTVDENLLAGTYPFVWDRERVQERIARVLELFPVLNDLRDQRAGTLSGGEQQMVALAKALLFEPKILLIDELSLGLAPVVVEQLLAIVARLKREGLTMIIVEQSVNVALSIADRAVFMEKGQVRFEGPAADLLERDDLIRAVFLGSEGG